jgi:hypothetical protein
LIPRPKLTGLYEKTVNGRCLRMESQRCRAKQELPYPEATVLAPTR